MDDKTFDALITKIWRRLTDGIDAKDPDRVEATATPDMVTVEFANGHSCVINTQRAVHQVWVAAQGRGLHFDWHAEEGEWKDDKGQGLELLRFVTDVVLAECGERVRF